METYRKKWKEIIYNALCEIAPDPAALRSSVSPVTILTETPPDSSLGDIAFPLFPFAKLLKESPSNIGEKLLKRLQGRGGEVSLKGPYLNVKLERAGVFKEILSAVERAGADFGRNDSLAGRRIMIEFSCPNTNKPLHLGHLRNDALGESLSRLLARCGAEVLKVNLINDRGIHICKSMLAYKKFGRGKTPESEGMKSDHFVGEYYVKFAQWAKEDAGAENQARALLKSWEAGEAETLALWKKMNGWAIAGIKQTYADTGIAFDRYYYESETYTAGRAEVLRGLDRKIFFKKEDGSVWIDLTDDGLDEKVLLRSDGTSLYITQDIGTAVIRQSDWAFDRMVYVTGSEQQYHFQVLFTVLKKLGHEWADKLEHLAYGMVNLPEGRMKSREGTVVDADDLLAELTDSAREEIASREREGEITDIGRTAFKIALGAVNYFLLSGTPRKDMVFNPRDSLSFTGDTGPYLQYTGARLSGILRKFSERRDRYAPGRLDCSLFTVEDEWDLVKQFAEFPQTVARTAAQLDPSLLTGYLFDCAKKFARYYHENQVLGNDDPHLVRTRIELVKAFLTVLKNGFELIGIPFLEAM